MGRTEPTSKPESKPGEHLGLPRPASNPVAPDEILPPSNPLEHDPPDPDDAAERGAEGLRMPIMEHLKELRVRLIRALIALAVGFTVAYFFSRSTIRGADRSRFAKYRTTSCC